MREILFRGKRIDNQLWVEGYYLCLCFRDGSPLHIIVDTEGQYHKVDPETVGQFTGLLDKNGKKIFEGDLAVSYDMFGKEECRGYVYWDTTFIGWHMGKYKSMYKETIATYEVIGNIHDNPELREVQE